MKNFLSNILKFIKISLTYGAVFLFILFLFIIKLIFNTGDDQIGPDCNDMDIVVPKVSEPEVKQTHQYKYSEPEHSDTDPVSTDEPAKTVTFTEDTGNRLFEIMALNLDSYIRNGSIEILATDDTKIDINNIKALIEGIRVREQSPIKLNESESDLYEELVKQIRSGRSVNIYISDSEKSLQPEDYFDTVKKSLGELSDKLYIHESSINKLEDLVKKQEDTLHKPFEYKPKHLIITTQSIGDYPLPLPSWHEVGEVPSIDDVQKRAEWEKNVAIQKYWTSKYPWFQGDYKRMELNNRIDGWVQGVESPNLDVSPENIPLPPQDEYEIKELNKAQDTEPKNVPSPPFPPSWTGKGKDIGKYKD